MRIGVFGGSFDPVHLGHLLLAECCREQANLDRVWFIPAAMQPHKRSGAHADGVHRAAMLALAIQGQPAFEVCDWELARGGVSYTVDTLTEVVRREPEAERLLLLGGDSLTELPSWLRPDEICRLATPLVVRRAGAADPDYQRLAAFLPPSRVEAIRAAEVRMPQIELSSTEIRLRVEQGQSIRFRTPPEVEEYIRRHGLYGQ